MSDAAFNALAPRMGRVARALTGVAVMLVIVGAALWFAPGDLMIGDVTFRPHAPDMAVFNDLSPAIQIHLVAAVSAFFLGLVQLLAPKGTVPHRIIGWTWVLIMLAAAISSIFIRQLNHGMFSFIHIFTGLTLVALPMGVYAARKGNIAAHRKHMTGVFFGGLIIAGLLAFMPGRVMWELLLG